MGRFLLYISYIGTRYSGIQRQNALVKGRPIITVESALQEAIRALRPANDFRIVLSSRTDKGVHAIKNTCHVDLTSPTEGKEYDPAVITSVLNFSLQSRNEDVRVLQTKRVSDKFHSRLSAKGRKYVYRLGHLVRSESGEGIFGSEISRESFHEELKKFSFRKSSHPRLPIGTVVSTLDASKVLMRRDRLDIDKLISAAGLLSGIHDYTSFTVKRKLYADYLPHPVKMLTIGVKRGQPLGHSLQKLGFDMTEDVEFWDIHIRSKSFLYKQVRRMVGAMVLVAKDAISLEDLKDIMENPRKDFPFSCLMGMAESGLFLLDVEYNPKDLEFTPEEKIGVTSSSSGDEVQPRIDNFHDVKLEDSDSDDSCIHLSSIDYSLPANSDTNHQARNVDIREVKWSEPVQVQSK